MIRSLFGQIISGLIVVGILVGWWMAAGKDTGQMATQAFGIVMWVGGLFQPLIAGVLSGTAQ